MDLSAAHKSPFDAVMVAIRYLPNDSTQSPPAVILTPRDVQTVNSCDATELRLPAGISLTCDSVGRCYTYSEWTFTHIFEYYNVFNSLAVARSRSVAANLGKDPKDMPRLPLPNTIPMHATVSL